MVDPTQMAATPPAAPVSGDSASAPADASQGYTICIHVDASQAISVSVEPGASPSDSGQTAADGSAMAGSDDESGDDQGNAQSMPNINAAIRIVKDIFNNAGQVQDADQSQTDMSSGFGGAQ